VTCEYCGERSSGSNTKAATLDRPVELIYGPAFSIFALSIPEDVGAAFKSRQILGGFFNRHLYLIGDKRAPKQDPVPGKARSTRDLLNILDKIAKAGATFKSLGDTWADTTTAHGRLMLTVLGGLAEFERELIRVRTGEGRVRAKARGVHMGRPFQA
jgi:hypothetical protein